LLEKLLAPFCTWESIIFVLPDRVLVRRAGRGLPGRIAGVFEQEYDLGPEGDLSTVLSLARTSMPSGSAGLCMLGLPLRHFSLASFTLPAAAARNLDEAVRYALMRHLPYDPEAARITYQSREDGERLDIFTLAIPDKALSAFLKAAASAGMTVQEVFPSLLYWARKKGEGIYVSLSAGYSEILVHSGARGFLHTWAEDEDLFVQEAEKLLSSMPNLPADLYLWGARDDAGAILDRMGLKPGKAVVLNLAHVRGDPGDKGYLQGISIDVLPPKIRRQQKAAAYLAVVGLAFFLLAVAFWPLGGYLGHKRYLDGLEQKIAETAPMAQEQRELAEKNLELKEKITALANRQKAYPQVLEILAEVTRVVPETAWLSSFTCFETQVDIQGEADSATAVLEAMEDSLLFSRVRFSAPVTRTGERDRFSLEAVVSP